MLPRVESVYSTMSNGICPGSIHTEPQASLPQR